MLAVRIWNASIWKTSMVMITFLLTRGKTMPWQTPRVLLRPMRRSLPGGTGCTISFSAELPWPGAHKLEREPSYFREYTTKTGRTWTSALYACTVCDMKVQIRDYPMAICRNGERAPAVAERKRFGKISVNRLLNVPNLPPSPNDPKLPTLTMVFGWVRPRTRAPELSVLLTILWPFGVSISVHGGCMVTPLWTRPRSVMFMHASASGDQHFSGVRSFVFQPGSSPRLATSACPSSDGWS